MKDKLTLVADAETVKAIQLNDFSSPVPVGETAEGYWVPADSLAMFRLWCLNLELGDSA